jgi:CRP-like cAMP-binding protein
MADVQGESPSHRRRGTLEDHLTADEIIPLPEISPAEWGRLRTSAVRRILWHFCTPRNLLAYRGRFHYDILGYGWAALYRTLRVGPVAVTSFRNEGHFRAGQRIVGTGEFAGIFKHGRESSDLQDVMRIVNLRHHVAGVVTPRKAADLPRDCSAWLPPGSRMAVRVIDGYEAEYASIATAFIDNLRRGLESCGVPRNSPAGRRVAAEMCTLMYQSAGAVGLTRVPRDLDAHDRFSASFEAAFAADPPSSRVRRMAQEIAKRILPVTAAMTGIDMKEHLERHVDPVSRDWLFPDPATTLAEVAPWFTEWKERRQRSGRTGFHSTRAAVRRELWAREDLAALWRAYEAADPEGPQARLIGAVLLHAIDEPDDPLRTRQPQTITLAAGEPLITQGQQMQRMLIVLESSEPLVVMRASEPGQKPQEVVQITAPNVLGEIGMWQQQPAVATVLCSRPATLRVISIDAKQFEGLKTDSGFRAATAASVQHRLALNSRTLATTLGEQARTTHDDRLRSVAQLLAFLGGDSHAPLDAVVGLPEDATPAECLDALREQAHTLVTQGRLPDDVRQSLQNVVDVVG